MRALDSTWSKHKQLPSSFADVALKGDNIVATHDIVQKYGVPEQWASAYVAAGATLKAIRDARDSIVHRGRDVGIVFDVERGFAIDRSNPHFRSLPFWRPEHLYNANLVSLRPLLSWFIRQTLDVLNSLASAIASTTSVPIDVVPQHELFLRHPHSRAFHETVSVLDGGSPWWRDQE